jgi:hypothetical protein
MNISRKEEMKSDDSSNVVDLNEYKGRATRDRKNKATDDEDTDCGCAVCRQTEGIIPEIIQSLLAILSEIKLKK